MKTIPPYRDRARLFINQIIKIRKCLNYYGLSKGDVAAKAFLCDKIQSELSLLCSDNQFKIYIKENYHVINSLIVHRPSEKTNSKNKSLNQLLEEAKH